jgi:predicted negative regulator of RcsB-dependent stress response
MATQLDLREQEQLDDIKAFWSKWGNLITWTLTVVLAGFAAYNGWQWWQRTQGEKASGMYDELDRAAQAGDADRVARMFSDLKDRHPKALPAAHGALIAAKVQAEKGKTDDALASLAWAADNAGDAELRVVARLRAAALHFEKKEFDKALAQLDAAAKMDAREFDGLIADRRGDVLQAQDKKSEAVAAYQTAFKALSDKLEYRRLVEGKLMALGAAPPADAAASGASK